MAALSGRFFWSLVTTAAATRAHPPTKRKAAEQPLLRLREEVVAPRDRVAQRLLPAGQSPVHP